MKMKKTLFFALFVIMLVTVLASCSSISNIKCMEPFNKHNIVIDKAVDPTCITTGLTQGEHCADCGMVLVAQSIIPEIAHTEVVDAAVESTCETTGLTEGSHCSGCGLIFVMQEEVAKKPHRELTVPGTAPTCTTDGCTDKVICADCDGVIVPSIVIEKGHRNVFEVDAVDSTCHSVGHTEGKFCTDCMTMIEGYVIVPKKDHILSAWIVEKDATEFEEGRRYQSCTVCGSVVNKEIIPQIADFTYVVNADGTTCTITGVTIYADIELYIPEYLDGYKVTAIGDDAFSQQTQIRMLYIPEGVESIGKAAFYDCNRLIRVMLPTSLTTIGNGAFDLCVKLDSVYYFGTAGMWKSIAIDANNDAISFIASRYYYSVEDPSTLEFKTGIFGDNGKLYYYVNGVKTYGGLMVIDGFYYYARTSGEIVTNDSYGITKHNNILPEGTYTFDADGKMINPPKEAGKSTAEVHYYWHYVDGVPARW